MRVANRTFSLRGLAAAASAAPIAMMGGNPYPSGIPVAGQGPGGLPFAVDWSPVMNTWIAHSPFGAFPLWTDENFAQVQQQIMCQAPFSAMYGNYFDESGNAWSDMLGYYDQNNQFGGNVCAAGLAYFQSGALGKVGHLDLITGGPPCGTGTQSAFYAFDASTGWYKPIRVQGSNNCPDISMLASFGIFVGLATVVIGGAAALAPAASAPAASIGATAATAQTGAGAAAATDVAAAGAVDVAAGSVAPEIAGFTVPEVAASAPLDLTTLSSTLVTASTSPLSGAFSVLGYIKQLAGAYSTFQSVSQLTGGAATHPQAGRVTHLPDGSVSVINPDGSITVTEPSGRQTTIGPGGSITPGYVQPGTYSVPAQAGIGATGALLIGSALLGMLFLNR